MLEKEIPHGLPPMETLVLSDSIYWTTDDTPQGIQWSFLNIILYE